MGRVGKSLLKAFQFKAVSPAKVLEYRREANIKSFLVYA